MRSLAPILAASSLLLVMAGCSPKPAAEPAEAATADEAAVVEGKGQAQVTPPPAQAGPPDPPQGMPAVPGRPMRRDDGPTTLAESQARADRGFHRMDANGDGAITSDEMGDGEGRGARMLERADANNDGRITRAEIQAATAARFRRMDLNGDGKVTEEERPQF